MGLNGGIIVQILLQCYSNGKYKSMISHYLGNRLKEYVLVFGVLKQIQD